MAETQIVARGLLAAQPVRTGQPATLDLSTLVKEGNGLVYCTLKLSAILFVSGEGTWAGSRCLATFIACRCARDKELEGPSARTECSQQFSVWLQSWRSRELGRHHVG